MQGLTLTLLIQAASEAKPKTQLYRAPKLLKKLLYKLISVISAQSFKSLICNAFVTSDLFGIWTLEIIT